MPFNWTDFLELSDELAQRDDEAALRTAISRAYCSALGKARELLESEGESFAASENLHSLVWNSFSNSSDDRRYYIGIDGRWLRLNRNAADYDTALTDPHGRARQAVRKAQTLLAALERIRHPG